VPDHEQPFVRLTVAERRAHALGQVADERHVADTLNGEHLAADQRQRRQHGPPRPAGLQAVVDE